MTDATKKPNPIMKLVHFLLTPMGLRIILTALIAMTFVFVIVGAVGPWSSTEVTDGSGTTWVTTSRLLTQSVCYTSAQYDPESYMKAAASMLLISFILAFIALWFLVPLILGKAVGTIRPIVATCSTLIFCCCLVGCVLAGSKYSLSWSWAVLTSPGLALSILATIMSGLAIILTPFALHVPKEAPAADAGAKAEPAPAVTDSQAAPVSVADSEAAAAPEAATVTA